MSRYFARFLNRLANTFLPRSIDTRPQPASKGKDDDLWSFSARQDRSIAQRAKEKKAEVAASKMVDPFDFSEFEDPGSLQSSALGGGGTGAKVSVKQTLSRQQSQPADDSEEDDDLLGSLTRTKPVVKAPSLPVTAAPVRQDGAVSPPPHIIGQIVEMGFSPIQARQALATTASGLDVSAAIEMLLEEQKNNASSHQERASESDYKMARRLQREEERMRPERRTAARPDRRDESAKANGIEVPQEWQKQADQIYSQASEIGASMFSKANALWSTAKAQAQKALDDRNLGGTESGQSSGRSSPATGSDRARSRRWAVPSRDGGGQRKEWQGKPKWMIDAENEEEQGEASPEQSRTAASQSGFRDDDVDRAEAPAQPVFEHPVKAQQVGSRPSPMNIWEEPEGSSSSSKMNNTFIPTPAAITSRKGSPLAASATSSRQSPVPYKAAAAKPIETDSKTYRRAETDDAGAIKTSQSLKERGNELFKRGSYIEAEVAYTNALGALRDNSLRRVALYNNRASTRLKNGDARNALEDTKSVLMLIVVTESKKGSPFLLYRPSKEHPLPLPEYADVNLRDGYAKALLRRAQAEEMLEQWETAQSVWSLLEKYEKEEGSGKNGMTNLRAAQEGGKRCTKMLRGSDNVELAPPAKRRVHAAAIQAIAKAERLAKDRIRSENAVAAAEEAEKDRLRDSVDGRVSAWKSNKETNVRALLASLHDVVWPGLGWKKVGMHELVMDNQVKRCYMRAIGKLHPDKVRLLYLHYSVFVR